MLDDQFNGSPPEGIQRSPGTYVDEPISDEEKEDPMIASSTLDGTQLSDKTSVQDDTQQSSRIYDQDDTESVKTSDDSAYSGTQLSSKTSDTITPYVFVALFGLMGLSLAGLWLLRRQKIK